MQVDRYERNWMWAATGMLALFLAAIVLTAVAGSAHPPSHTETIDPETLTIGGEFATPGVTTHADGRAVVVMRAEFYVLRPEVIRVPAGRPVTFRITSPDVLHGFQIVGTNVNLTVAPGYISEVTTTFARPGEYLVVCNEFCGLSHHPGRAADDSAHAAAAGELPVVPLGTRVTRGDPDHAPRAGALPAMSRSAVSLTSRRVVFL